MLSLDAAGSHKPVEQAMQDLSLEDVWRFYHEPSLFGREVRGFGAQWGKLSSGEGDTGLVFENVWGSILGQAYFEARVKRGAAETRTRQDGGNDL